MSAMEPLSNILGIESTRLSKFEKIILELELFARLCEAVSRELSITYDFMSYKSDLKRESMMFEMNAGRVLINDILSTNEYTLQGIALYTDTHEDIVQEVAIGINTQPSAYFLRRIIELHRVIRRELYCSLITKVLSGYLEHNKPMSTPV